MPLTLLLGVLTLTPAACALVIAALGLAKRALPPVVLALAAIGVLVPAICLLVLVPYLASSEPLRLSLFGGVTGPTAWFSPIYRADAFSLYAGLGLAFLIAPVLLWLAWQGPSVAGRQATTGNGGTTTWFSGRSALAGITWGSVALALGVETAALTLLFADNILWLGLSWVVLAALAWGLGEVGAGDTMDRAGLAFALAGPVLWTGAMLVGAVPAHAPTLYDLMGRGSYTVVEVIVLALTLALAGGAYPFAVWVRRRGILAAPAGVAAVTLALVPIALYVGSRTYSAAQDAGSSWPTIGKATPPITAGIAFALLGAITVGSAGLLALERRGIRSTLALLAVAQFGWGFLALGTGNPGSMLGLTVLLATTILGLGAMICAAFAGGTLGDEDEREGAGPRPFGAPASTPNLIAWCAGAVMLIGVPLFGGFVSRQMISAAALTVGNLTVPLIGLAWAGDGLLAIALLRLTAPAFTAVRSRPKVELEAEYQAMALALNGTDAPNDAGFAADEVNRAGAPSSDDDFTAEETVDEDEEDEEDAAAPGAVAPPNDLRELPGLIFAALALVVGIVPQLLLNFGGTLAAGELAQAGAVDSASHTVTLGYTTGPGQWLASLAWLVLVVLVVALLLLRPGASRGVKPVLLAGQSEADIADSAAPELAGMAEPLDAWSDITPAFTSPFTLPAGEWLLPSSAAMDHLDHDIPDETVVEGAEFVDDEATGQSTGVVVEADDVYEPSAAAQPEDAAPTDTAAPQAETQPEAANGPAGEAAPEAAPEVAPAVSPEDAEAASAEAPEALEAPDEAPDEAPAQPVEPAAAQAQASDAAELPAEKSTEAAAPATRDAPSHAPPKRPAQSSETVATRVNGRTGNTNNQSRSGNRGKSGKSGRAGKKGGR